jgi:hypothetical protein
MTAIYCSAAFCTNNSKKNPSLKFHRFPANPKKQKKWWDFCELTKFIKNGYLCSDHFLESDYTLLKIALSPDEENKYILNKESVPSIRGKVVEEIEEPEELAENMEVEALQEEYLEDPPVTSELDELKSQLNELQDLLRIKDSRIQELEEKLKCQETEEPQEDPLIIIDVPETPSGPLDLASYIDQLEKENQEILKGSEIQVPYQEEKTMDLSDSEESVTVERQESLIIVPPTPKMILYPPKTGDKPTLAICEFTETFVCLQCNEIFLNQRALNVHERAEHPPVDGFVCKVCEKKFEKYEMMRRHQRIHVVGEYLKIYLKFFLNFCLTF